MKKGSYLIQRQFVSNLRICKVLGTLVSYVVRSYIAYLAKPYVININVIHKLFIMHHRSNVFILEGTLYSLYMLKIFK